MTSWAPMRCVCFVTLSAVLSTGCADVSESQTYSWKIEGSGPDMMPILLAGVEICELGSNNCVETDVNGRAEITVPRDQEIVFTLEKDGYGSILRPDVSDETVGPSIVVDPVEARMYPDDQLAEIAERLGVRYPWTDGVVGFNVPNNPLVGGTFAPVGATVGVVGESFYYDVGLREYRLDLSATTGVDGAHRLPLHEGGFLEVAPGEHLFEYGGTASGCTSSWGWRADASNRVRVPVRTGFVTYTSMVCD